MGQKVNPISFRLGITRSWDSVWYTDSDYKKFLHEDIRLRQEIHKKFPRSGIVRIVIERFTEKVNIVIHTARPGIIIGHKGASIEKLRLDLRAKISPNLHISIVEVKKPETVAQIIADTIAQQLEGRMPFRRVMKQALRSAVRSGIEGIKISISGRLNGADMARKMSYKDGRVPLHTLRANVDYAISTAKTTYGMIGVKAWTYTGDYIEKKNEKKEENKYMVKRRLL